ncbi:MAG: signal peptidase II, partial [Flavobacterium sp.]
MTKYQFSADQIQWVKNVKRAGGTAWAYFGEGMEWEFNLNFSDSQKLGAENMGLNEVVLLFQRVDSVPGVVTQTYLTHLVKPLDNELIYNADTPLHPWERRVAVIARADPRTSIYTHADDLSFYKPNWGKVCPIQLLNDDLTVHQIQQRIVALFQNCFCGLSEVYINNITLTKVENTGAFLSVGSVLPEFLKFILLILLPAIVLLTGLSFILSKAKLSKLTIVGAAFVIGGGMG